MGLWWRSWWNLQVSAYTDYSFWLQTTVIPHLTFTAKVGTTNYFDRNRIGTGYQAINQSWATDIALESKVKF